VNEIGRRLAWESPTVGVIERPDGRGWFLPCSGTGGFLPFPRSDVRLYPPIYERVEETHRRTSSRSTEGSRSTSGFGRFTDGGSQ
jgi:hypothetical protein